MSYQTLAFSLYAANDQRKYLNGEERRRFMNAADHAAPEVRTLCLTLAYLGCHISEALALTGGDVATDAGLIAIRSLKKRGQLAVREVPAAPDLLAILAEVHPLDYRRARLWPWGRTTAWRAVKNVMVAVIAYHLRTGGAWRDLPPWFPNWRTVYGWFRRWTAMGLFDEARRHVARLRREARGRDRPPTLAIVDTQCVRCISVRGPRGYDAGKKVMGR